MYVYITEIPKCTSTWGVSGACCHSSSAPSPPSSAASAPNNGLSCFSPALSKRQRTSA